VEYVNSGRWEDLIDDLENQGSVSVANEALLYTPNPHPKKNRVAGFPFPSGLGCWVGAFVGKRAQILKR
jgi:hypothetical protein